MLSFKPGGVSDLAGAVLNLPLSDASDGLCDSFRSTNLTSSQTASPVALPSAPATTLDCIQGGLHAICGMRIGPMTVEEHVVCVPRACPVNGNWSWKLSGCAPRCIELFIWSKHWTSYIHEDEKVPAVLHCQLYKVCPMCRAEIPADGPLLNSTSQDVPEDTATLRNLWFWPLWLLRRLWFLRTFTPFIPLSSFALA